MSKIAITAVMVTRGTRPLLARMSVTSFLEQDYDDKQLFILNTGEPIYSDREPPDGVFEVVRQDLDLQPLGAVRNLSLSLAESFVGRDRYILQWDDDDWSHPDRMLSQANGLDSVGTNKRALILKTQVRLDLERKLGMVFLWPWDNPRGIPGTVLLPPRKVVDYKYDESLRKHEDTELLRKYFGGYSTLVLLDKPHLYLRLFHGGNTWDRDHFFVKQPLLPFSKLQPQAVGDYVQYWYDKYGSKLVPGA